MNIKTIIAFFIFVGEALLPCHVQASVIDTDTAEQKTLKHNLSGWSIPSVVNSETWWNDNGSFNLKIKASSSNGWADLTVNGTPVGISSQGSTIYATNNPGIGIAYEINYDPQNLTTPNNAFVSPNTLPFTTNNSANGYLHVKYIIVRLSENIPAGAITQVPDVTLNYHNPAGSGYPDISFLALSGVSAQPIMTACTINAPKEINLSPLYGNTLAAGAQGAIDVPTITLTNCPGAISNITYNYSPVYGAQTANSGILNTVTGDGYARGVYFQVQNANGDAIAVNSETPLANYNGSGDYTLPDIKIAYYIPDETAVTTGNVKSAIELKVTYN